MIVKSIFLCVLFSMGLQAHQNNNQQATIVASLAALSQKQKQLTARKEQLQRELADLEKKNLKQTMHKKINNNIPPTLRR